MAGRFSTLGRALLTRVFILALALTFIAIVIIAFFNFNILKKGRIQDTNLTLSQSSIIVGEFFNHQFSHLETLALTSSIQSMEQESSKLYLERLLKENPEFIKIALVSYSGKEIVAVSRYENIPRGSLRWHGEDTEFKEALAGKRGHGYVVFEEGRPTLEISVPVKRSPGDVAGVLAAKLDLRFLSEWLGQIKLGRTGVIYLVDRGGSIIAHSELPLATGGIQTLHFPSVTAVLQGQGVIPYGSGSRYQNLYGERVVAGAMPLAPMGWGLVMEINEGEIVANILPIALGMTASAIFVIGIVFLMAVVLFKRRVIEPISALSRAVQEVEEGKEVRPLFLTKRDEIGTLSRAFFNTQATLNATIRDLRRSQSFASTILENIPHGAFLLDPDGKIKYASGTVAKEFNALPQDLVGANVVKMMEPAYREKFEERWEELKQKLTLFEFEMRYLTGRGKVEPGLISVAPVLSPQGNFDGAVLLGVNLSKVKEEEKKRLIEERLANMGLLASKLSHELRNVLGAMSNSIYFLRQTLKDSEDKVKRHLEILGQQVDTGTHLVASILDFARPQEPSFYPISLNQVIQQALEQVPLTQEVEVVMSLDPNLPSISGDAHLLMQVIINLIYNASQAMPQGGKITLKTRVEDNLAVAEVQDTGAGMEPDFLKNLFKPFHSGKPRGMGLGLSISKDTIEKHGGNIQVQSKTGEGSTFIISLPLKIA